MSLITANKIRGMFKRHPELGYQSNQFRGAIHLLINPDGAIVHYEIDSLNPLEPKIPHSSPEPFESWPKRERLEYAYRVRTKDYGIDFSEYTVQTYTWRILPYPAQNCYELHIGREAYNRDRYDLRHDRHLDCEHNETLEYCINRAFQGIVDHYIYRPIWLQDPRDHRVSLLVNLSFHEPEFEVYHGDTFTRAKLYSWGVEIQAGHGNGYGHEWTIPLDGADAYRIDRQYSDPDL